MNDLSYWMSTVDDDLTPRPPLARRAALFSRLLGK